MYVLLMMLMLLPTVSQDASAIRGLHTKSGSRQPLSRLEKDALTGSNRMGTRYKYHFVNEC